jgi:hypothetical protein
MAVPYTFANASVSIPLSQLDSNFGTTITLGNTAIQLGNTVTTLNNMTLVNVTVSSGNATFTNVTVSNSTLTNVTISGGSANALVLTNANIRSVVSTFPNNFLGNSSTTLGNSVLTLGSTTANLGNITIANVTVQSGNVTANLANSTVDGINTVGYLNIPQNTQAGNYQLVASDSGKQIFHALGAANVTYTIPANATVSFATGTVVTFVNLSANVANIAITTDTLYSAGTGTTGTRVLAQYGVATIIKAANTTWIISGSGLS